MNSTRKITIRWNEVRILLIILIVFYISSVCLVMNGMGFISTLRALLGVLVLLFIPGLLIVHIFIEDKIFEDPLVYFSFSFITSVAIITIISVIINQFLSINENSSIVSQIFVFSFLFVMDILAERVRMQKNTAIISIPFKKEIINKKILFIIILAIGFLFTFSVGIFFPSLDQGYIEIKLYNSEFNGLPPRIIKENATILINVQICNNYYYGINCSLLVKIENATYMNFDSILINPYDHKNVTFLLSDLKQGSYTIYLMIIRINKESLTLTYQLMVL